MLMTGMRAVTDSLAHDLRSPLTRAKGSIEFALRREADAEIYRQALEQTNTELDTILRTFEALINIAEAEAGVIRLTMTDLDLSDLMHDLFEMYQPIAEDAGLELVPEIAPEITVTGHRQMLGQAVANLLDNAGKFTQRGGRIVISLETSNGSPVLRVTDNGPGIPAEHRERVLQRFVRLDSSRTAPGSGLGLSLVAAVARLHDATLTLSDNQPGLSASLAFPASRRGLTSAADRTQSGSRCRPKAIENKRKSQFLQNPPFNISEAIWDNTGDQCSIPPFRP
jgi:signal transduction histidine kinase